MPLCIFLCVSVIDIIDYFEKSSQLLPVTSIVFFTFLWFILQIPASFLGSYQAWRNIEYKPPMKVSDVRRRIPDQPWYLSFKIQCGFSGLIIFATIMSEFHYVITSVWRSQILGMFGFMLLTLFFMCSVTSLVSVIGTYLNLRAENWRWWWRAWWSGFSVSAWCFLYCMYFELVVFGLDTFSSDVVFTIYAAMLSCAVGLMCASISVAVSFLFVHLLYSTSKLD